MQRRRRLLGGLALFATAITALVVFSPFIRLAYSNVGLHVALDTAEGMAAAFLAFLAMGRFSSSRQVRDLLLALGFAGAGVGNLALSAVAYTVTESRSTGATVWGAVALRTLSAALVLAAAVVRDRRVGTTEGLRTKVLLAVVASAAAVTVCAVVADATLASVTDPDLGEVGSTFPRIEGHAFVLVLQLGLMFTYACAAFALVRAADHEDDELLFWLGAGAMLAAFARFNYFLFPSLYSPWVYTGDVLRFGAYCLYVYGAQREVRSYVRARARVAVLEERRRVAREVHDGLSQELSFLRSQLASGRPVAAEMVPHLAAAADRAYAESRGLIETLNDVAGPSFERTLRAAADEVARRHGVAVEVTVDERAPLGDGARGEIVRIVREATANAARHSGSAVVRVDIERAGDGARVRIVDDGRGFDERIVHDGFGLRSMRERAAAIGAELRIDSRPNVGTAVEVVLPGV